MVVTRGIKMKNVEFDDAKMKYYEWYEGSESVQSKTIEDKYKNDMD